MAPERYKKGHSSLGRFLKKKKKKKSLFASWNCSFKPPNEKLFLADHLESAKEHKAFRSASLSAESQHAASREG